VAQTKIPLLREYAARFLDYIEQTPLDPDTKRYYRTGWRLLSNTKLAEMRLDTSQLRMPRLRNFPALQPRQIVRFAHPEADAFASQSM